MGKKEEKQLVANILGKNIRYHRNKNGMTIEELAYHAQIDDKNLGRIERGKRSPLPETLYKIATVLEISPNDIFEGLEGLLKTIPTNNDK